MNIILDVSYLNIVYKVEYNEPDSTPDPKDYVVRIEAIKSSSEINENMEKQIGKEFLYKSAESFSADMKNSLDSIIKAYRDHIAKDVEGNQRK